MSCHATYYDMNKIVSQSYLLIAGWKNFVYGTINLLYDEQ